MTNRHVGRSVERVDGRAKVTGSAVYTVDVVRPGMLHAAIVRSERAHAIIRSIDRSAARALPDVVAVITADDLGHLDPYYGHILRDHPVLAIGKVRFMGEPVALVVGHTRRAALAAAREVLVEYEDLEHAIHIDEALRDDPPLVHGDAYRRGTGVAWETIPDDHVGTNVAHEASLEWGDVDVAFGRAHLIVTTTSIYPMLYAYAMEPYTAVAEYRGGKLNVTSSTQHPFMVRAELARIFRVPQSSVQVEAPYVGGGYGSKSWTKVEPLAAVAAQVTGRAVRVALSVEEAMLTTRADSARVAVRSGFDADGRILARAFEIDFNTGAYADSSPSILDKAVHRCFGPYRIPNLRIDARLVYTNTVPASSYRGFGAPQTNLAGEYNIDKAASLLGIDGREIRKRNLLAKGDQVLPKRRPLDADLEADLDILVDSLEAQPMPVLRPHDRYGIGFGCSASDAGAFPASTAMVRVGPDGSALVMSGAVEIGQGSATVLSQIAAEELGLPMQQVAVAQSSTVATPFERTTNGSRTTTLVGLAVQRAARNAVAELCRMAASTWEIDQQLIGACAGVVAGPDGRSASFGEVVEAWFGADAGEAVGIGIVRPEGDTKAMPPFWEIGMVGVGLRIDDETGEVRVQRLSTVGDVGFAINPAAMEGQDLGAATQGLGGALFEELTYDGGQLTNANLVDYRVPRSTDMPREIFSHLAERRDGIGPYGAKGGGEGSLNPVGGAVMSAVARALDVWPDEVQLPLTPERVWRLMQRSEP